MHPLGGRGRRRPVAVLAALAASSACGPSPTEVVREVHRAVADGDRAALERAIAPRYADGVGDRARLFEQLEALWRTHPERSVELGELSVTWDGPSRARARVEVTELAFSAGGDASRVARRGRAELELARDGRLRVVSGLLTPLRDVMEQLEQARRALEANAPARLARHLHPLYRVGADNRTRALERLAAWLGERPVRIRPTGLRLDVRADLVHVDAHHRLTVGDAPAEDGVLRLTLAAQAGRWAVRSARRDPIPRSGTAKPRTSP